YEIVHTFGVPAELTDEQLDHHTIGETINYSRYVHARLLSHFLLRRRSDKKVRTDDAVAEDFGFDSTTLPYTDEERQKKAKNDEVNKALLHLTYDRVKRATKKHWDKQLLDGLLTPTIKFMRHIHDHARTILPIGGDLFANEREREGWKTLLA